MTQLQIRAASREDRAALTTLAVSSGLFETDDIGALDGMLGEYFDDKLPEHVWVVATVARAIAGAAYHAPEMMTDGTRNLYFIAVDPGSQGGGIDRALLEHVEQALERAHQRLLVIETAGLEGFERTRKFYRTRGYVEEARIRYAAGDDEVFSKLLGVGRTAES